tara:strand:+ start:7 stop:1851 length:1845 start_codon:yes stop_codon:yes gene_type:complete
MSLVILSSQQTFNSGANDLNVERSSTFQNNFSKAVEIPENAEVAVISAKINRQQLSNVDSRTNFKLYAGEELSSSKALSDTTSVPFTIDLYNKGESNNLSPIEFAERVQESIDESFFHPNFIGTTLTSASYTGKQYEGLQFVYTSRLNGSESSSLSSTEWLPFNEDSSGNASVTASGTYGRVIKGTGASGEGNNVFVGTDSPLDPTGGIFEFSPSNGASNTTQWAVGLSRALPNIYGIKPAATLEEVYPPSFDAGENPDGYLGYYDYMIECDEDNDIRVFQCGYNGLVRMLDEIDYTNVGATANTSATTGVYFNASDFSKYKFELVNEKLTISGYDPVGLRYKTIIAPNTTTDIDFDHTIGPVSQNCWSLYPVVELLVNDDFIKMERWNGAYKSGPVNISYATQTFYGQVFYAPGVEIFDTTQDLEFRSFYNILAQVNKTYAGLRTHSVTTHTIDKNIVMILGEEERYTPKYLFPENNFDMASFFGWDVAIVNETLYAVINTSKNVRTFDPVSSVTEMNLREAFIKLDSLNIESYNGATSDIGKIIYGIPRFDNSGAAVGPLYFENSDRYYLKLNNVSPLLLNRMDVSIVNVDNTLVEDLYGNTVISLHIKKSV